MSVIKDSRSLTESTLFIGTGLRPFLAWCGCAGQHGNNVKFNQWQEQTFEYWSFGHLVPMLLMFLGTFHRDWKRHFCGSEVPFSVQLQASWIECRAFPQHCWKQLCQAMGSPDHDNISSVSTDGHFHREGLCWVWRGSWELHFATCVQYFLAPCGVWGRALYQCGDCSVATAVPASTVSCTFSSGSPSGSCWSFLAPLTPSGVKGREPCRLLVVHKKIKKKKKRKRNRKNNKE